MKYLRLLTVTCLLQFTSTCIAAEPDGFTETRRPLNQVVAIVNDGVIVSSELGAAIVEIEKQLQSRNTQVPSRDVLAKQVLERLVVEKLQLQIAEQGGMTIDDNTLNEEIRTLARENGMTLADFRAVLERDGYDYPAFREDLRKQLLIQQTRRQMVGSRIKVSDQEIDNLLASASGKTDVEYHLAHILVSIPEAASPEQIAAAESRASKLLERLRGGADFASTAIAESDGQTALEGGDIGWRSIGQMPSLFVEPVKLMQAGQVSDLIRNSGGFHIIKLLEKRGDERHIMRQTLARHILLTPDILNTDEENLARIRQLEIRLRGGEDFATLARSNSQDTVSAARGGELGWLSPGDTVPEFEVAMNALAPGEISAPVKTSFGWHLIQVMERREHDSTEEFERNQARKLIRSRKYDEELLLWLRRLRDEAYVEYRLDDA
ncbi:MAG: peptidylprolyl isomerase [Gammaproteobacteria bacterium]|nr:peptidylprolyl isomerase [Gammaproteobacteria bacterium]MDH5514682.1 peptidylprolyl isomerase [Gammaproteobacteria bacterium]